MNKFILCQGISGSGKTTWAKQWVEEDPIHRVRLNYDDLRCMLGKYWVPEREPLMKKVFDTALDDAMFAGYNIVIDNMSNLNPKHIQEYQSLVHSHNLEYKDNQYEIEYKLFDTPVEVCIERDSKREIPIGEKVIKQQWKKYRNFIISSSVKNMLSNQAEEITGLPHCIIVDMDATLCFNTTGRSFFGPGAAEQMINDVPNINVADLVRAYCDQYGCELVVITGRDEPCREVTLKWLDEHYLYPDKLFMRPEGSFLSGPEQKKLIYEKEIKGVYNVDLVFEDNSKVTKMYRDLGLTVLQVNEGKF